MLRELLAGLEAAGAIRDSESASRLAAFCEKAEPSWKQAEPEAQLYVVVAAMIAAVASAAVCAVGFARLPEFRLAAFLALAATDGFADEASLWLGADLERERARQADELRQLWPDWPGLPDGALE